MTFCGEHVDQLLDFGQPIKSVVLAHTLALLLTALKLLLRALLTQIYTVASVLDHAIKLGLIHLVVAALTGIKKVFLFQIKLLLRYAKTTIPYGKKGSSLLYTG